METNMFWTKEEDELLKNNYQLKKIELLKLFPNRTAAAINIRASNLSLKKEKNEYVEGNLKKLLDENLETYYWIGFILADGCFVKNRFTITLSIKDADHLKKLASFLECENIIKYKYKTSLSKKESEFIKFSIQDNFYSPKIKEKFDIKHAKTYNPPEKLVEDFDKFLSLFIGYIDGDGSIRKRKNMETSQISIKVHSSWMDFLKKCQSKIDNYLNIKSKNVIKLNKQGYVLFNITNSKVYKFLKTFALEKKLPILYRKWNNINEKFITKTEISEKRKITVMSLYNNGKSVKEITKITNLKFGCVAAIIRKSKKGGMS